MTATSLAIIVNPAAGPPGRRPDPRDLRERARAEGFAARLLVTRRPGEATQLAREAARDADLVLAAGGDGTVHEVARGLLETPRPLAVLPLGSGNDLAADLGVTDADAAWRSLRGRAVPRDVGWWDDEPFFNSCGLLLSGEVSRRAAAVSRRLGAGRYWLAAAAGLAAYRPVLARWSLAGETPQERDGAWCLAEVGVGRRTGGGFLLTPRADPADGLLDLCLVAHLPRRRLLRLLPAGRRGNHLGAPGVHYHRVPAFSVTVGRATAIHLDGEARPLSPGTYRCRCQRAALTCLVPAGAGTAPPPGDPREERA